MHRTVYIDKPVEKIILKTIEVPVEIKKEVVIERIVEVPVEHIVYKTVVKQVKASEPTYVEVVREVPEIIEEIQYIDVPLLRETATVMTELQQTKERKPE